MSFSGGTLATTGTSQKIGLKLTMDIETLGMRSPGLMTFLLILQLMAKLWIHGMQIDLNL